MTLPDQIEAHLRQLGPIQARRKTALLLAEALPALRKMQEYREVAALAVLDVELLDTAAKGCQTREELKEQVDLLVEQVRVLTRDPAARASRFASANLVFNAAATVDEMPSGPLSP